MTMNKYYIREKVTTNTGEYH